MTAAPIQIRPKRRKWLWRTLWAFLALLFGGIGFWQWSYRTALAERDRLIAEMHSEGKPVWWDELADKLIAESPTDSGAEMYLKAIGNLYGDFNPNATLAVPANKLWHDLKVEFPEPQILPEVVSNLQRAGPVFDWLGKAVVRKPALLTQNIKGGNPYTIRLSHIQDSHTLLRLLYWGVFDALARGQAARAYHTVWLGLAASSQLTHEPWVISQFVRLEMQTKACEQLRMCLRYAAVPEDEYQRLDAFFAANEQSFHLDPCLSGDLAMGLCVWENRDDARSHLRDWQIARKSAPNAFEQWFSERWLEVLASPLGRPALLKTQIEELRLHQRVANLIDRPNVDPAEIDAAFEEFERRSPMHQMADGDQGKSKGLRLFAKHVVSAHRRLILHRLALRLRRHYDRHGSFPSKLEDICDAAMPSVRLDWFGNRSIGYKSSKTGFTLEPPGEAVLEIELKKLPTPLGAAK